MNAPTLTNDELRAMIARLQDENTRLRTSRQSPIRFKVGEKGALSMYGLGRFPVTLYKSQWQRLLGATKDIEQALADHAAQLTDKA